ncbi:hypothetical protein EVA_15149 [gut metagenome]|uniref:Uncharacterized protein n=1 Tax=gut metagenome TaxID=749906 RepID=J9FQI3_9ZZZZ
MNRKCTRNTFCNISSFDFNFKNFRARECGSDFFLDHFCSRFTNKHAEISANVVDDGLVEFIAANSHRIGINHSSQRNQTNLSCSSSDINNKGTGSFIYG